MLGERISLRPVGVMDAQAASSEARALLFAHGHKVALAALWKCTVASRHRVGKARRRTGIIDVAVWGIASASEVIARVEESRHRAGGRHCAGGRHRAGGRP